MNLLPLRQQFTLDALTLGSSLCPLLTHYEVAPHAADLARTVVASFHLSYTGDAERVWKAAPRDGSPLFLRAMSKISVEIQKAMRAWIHLLWTSDIENLRDTDRSAQVAAYLALQPFYPKRKHAYTYDVLETGCLRGIDRNLRLFYSGVLEAFSAQLRVAGEHALAQFYSSRHSNWFLDQVLKSPKHLYEILTREEKVIRHWGPFLSHGIPPEKLESVRESVAVEFRSILRRDDDWRFLVPLIEIEATTGLERYLDVPLGRRLEITISPAGQPQSPGSKAQGGNVIVFPSQLAA
jgi:hypothetical protein